MELKKVIFGIIGTSKIMVEIRKQIRLVYLADFK